MLTPKPPCRSTSTLEDLQLLNFSPPRLNSLQVQRPLIVVKSPPIHRMALPFLDQLLTPFSITFLDSDLPLETLSRD